MLNAPKFLDFKLCQYSKHTYFWCSNWKYMFDTTIVSKLPFKFTRGFFCFTEKLVTFWALLNKYNNITTVKQVNFSLQYKTYFIVELKTESLFLSVACFWICVQYLGLAFTVWERYLVLFIWRPVYMILRSYR